MRPPALVSYLLIAGLCTRPVLCAAQADSTVPHTVDEAVRYLRTRWLGRESLDWILRTPKDVATSEMHLPFGTQVRNQFRLWQGNTALLQSCGVADPEGCSAIIFAHLWEAVRADADTGLVRALDCQFALTEKVQVRYVGFYKLRLGEIIDSVQAQIDRQVGSQTSGQPAGCRASRVLRLRAQGGPKAGCWARIEYSEDGHDPVSLERFLSWFSWRNAFTTMNAPPYIDLRFNQPCAWPKPPVGFQPADWPG
jgi:hypothetical protein